MGRPSEGLITAFAAPCPVPSPDPIPYCRGANVSRILDRRAGPYLRSEHNNRDGGRMFPRTRDLRR